MNTNGVLRKVSNARALFVVVAMMSLSGCASCDDYLHQNIRYGEVLEASATEIVFCVGCQDRVRIGQIVNVYQRIYHGEGHGRRYRKITMAVAQITGFVNERTAKAAVLHGTVTKECEVEI